MPDFNATIAAATSSAATIAAEIPQPRPLVPVTGGRPATNAHTRPGRRLPGPRPLPDAACIYQVIIPQTAPPYDDDTPASISPLAPLRRVAVAGSPAQARPVRALRPQSPADGHPSPGQPTTQPPARTTQPPAGTTQPPAGTARPTAQPPAGGTWPSRFAQALAETLAGTRPPEQIAAWTTERARKRISQLGPLMATAHRPRIKRILAASPTSGVLEMTIIVGLGPRVRALAVRLERADQLTPDSGVPDLRAQPGHLDSATHWRCTAVDAA